MVRISSSTRTEPDLGRDGDARVDRYERTDGRRDGERAMADRAAAERAADDAENRQIASAELGRIDQTGQMARPTDMERTTGPRDVEREPPPAGPKPRASLLATLGLISGVTAAFLVLTGLLAGWGVALGVIAVPLSIGGIMGTRRRHVAGRTDALIGLALGLGAVVVGITALTGAWSWLTADTNMVQRFREWLDTQFVDRF